MVQLIIATREPAQYSDELAQHIEYGASPRATIALDKCAKAHAWLADRDFVTPDDVQQIATNVLAHRITPSLAASTQGITNGSIINQLLQQVPSI